MSETKWQIVNIPNQGSYRICPSCGSVVDSQKVHEKFHENLLKVAKGVHYHHPDYDSWAAAGSLLK